MTAPAYTCLSVPDGTKGYLWINGHLLGRYWSVGPQRTLYVPRPLLRAGRNEVVVLDLDAAELSTVDLHTAPHLG
ncbi:hypothetical protein CS0771_01940 [Catellatospora sp. IY07-71]|nr:hypothetical protein CS0771_01940 [Catellatospora sp. IY07-71]